MPRAARQGLACLEGVGEAVGYRSLERANVFKSAERRAKDIVRNLGGGEVTFRDDRGRIVDSDTVAPARDPNPPKDTKH